MLADFIITVHEARKPLAVQVKVYERVSDLRRAATRYHNRYMALGRRKNNEADFSDTLGICHRFHTDKDSLCSIVRLAEPNLGAGLVAHEMAHAAVWMWEIDHKFEDVVLTCANDEWFCWVLGELVRQTTLKFIEKGIY